MLLQQIPKALTSLVLRDLYDYGQVFAKSGSVNCVLSKLATVTSLKYMTLSMCVPFA